MEALILTAVSESGVEVRLSETTGGYRVERIGPRSSALNHRFLAEALRDFADRVDGRITREVFGVQLGEVRAITQIDGESRRIP